MSHDGSTSTTQQQLNAVPAWITPALISEILALLQQYLEKELTTDDILPLLLPLPLSCSLRPREQQQGEGVSGSKDVTTVVKIALKNAGIPAIRLHTRGQYYARIGYRRSASGIRQRAFFYLGRDEKSAVAKAAALKYAWRELKRKHGSGAVWSDRCINQADPCLAHLSPIDAALSVEQHHSEMTIDALEQGSVTVVGRDANTGRTTQMSPEPSDNVSEQMPKLRVEQVREMYCDYRRGKLGIGGGQGINEKTFNGECRNLKGGLGSLNFRTLINSLTYAEIEKLRDDIFRRVSTAANGISKRTANNYWLEIQRMLNWAHRQSNVGYRHPEDVTDLFKRRFRNPNPVKIEVYDAEKLKKLLKPATDRQRLYIYLALNCGHYQIDIGLLRRDEVVEYEGQTAIMRRRSKTAQQNDFEALHVLWPETAALLKREMVRSANVSIGTATLALLSNRGTSLYRRSPKCDIISDVHLALQHGAEVKLPFKQFRKIGATAMQRLGGDETRRLYKAGTIEDGDKVYVREAWEKLTPHLMAWGDELRRDGILFDRASEMRS